jgi:hypothetical protein
MVVTVSMLIGIRDVQLHIGIAGEGIVGVMAAAELDDYGCTRSTREAPAVLAVQAVQEERYSCRRVSESSC